MLRSRDGRASKTIILRRDPQSLSTALWVGHDILIRPLISVGMSVKQLEWLRSFLSGRVSCADFATVLDFCGALNQL